MPVSTRSINKDAAYRLREMFCCSQETMGHIVGVCDKTIARWEKNKSRPRPSAKQKLAELQLVSKEMEGVIKNGKEGEWLNSPNEDLAHKTPLEVMMRGHEGVEEVLHLLGRVKWGIPT